MGGSRLLPASVPRLPAAGLELNLVPWRRHYLGGHVSCMHKTSVMERLMISRACGEATA